MDRKIPEEELRRHRNRRIAIALGSVAGCVLLIWYVMTMLTPEVRQSDLTVSEATVGTIDASISSSGVVKPAFEQVITSPISSRIVEVYCKAGDTVASGTPLLRLDLQNAETEMRRLSDRKRMKRAELDKQSENEMTSLADLEMRIKVKELEVSRMEVELKNERYLDSLGSGTGDKVREVELAYNTGQLSLQQLRTQLEGERRKANADRQVKQLELNICDGDIEEMKRTLDEARIRAPRSATISYINDQIGLKVTEGERLVVLSDLSDFKITAQAPDVYADDIRPGAMAVVKFGKTKFGGSVINVEPKSQNGMLVFDVRVDSADMSRMRAGLKADVYVIHDIKDDVVRIANGSYYKGPGEYKLFVAEDDDDMMTLREVRLGECNYEYVEVVSGLRPGDRVVVSDMSEFRNRKKIKIKK